MASPTPLHWRTSVACEESGTSTAIGHRFYHVKSSPYPRQHAIRMNISRSQQPQQAELHPMNRSRMNATDIADDRSVCQLPGGGTEQNYQTHRHQRSTFAAKGGQKQSKTASAWVFASAWQSGERPRVPALVVGDSARSCSHQARGAAASKRVDRSVPFDASRTA